MRREPSGLVKLSQNHRHRDKCFHPSITKTVILTLLPEKEHAQYPLHYTQDYSANIYFTIFTRRVHKALI